LYTWDFKDGNTSSSTTDLAPINTFTSAGAYEVSMTASYTGVDNCVFTPTSQTISIVSPPTGTELDLIRSDNTDAQNFEKCPSGQIDLSVAGTFLTYAWESKLNVADVYNPNGSSTSQVITDTLIVQVKLTDTNECSFTANSVSVKNLQNSGFSIEVASSNTIITDDALIGKKILFDEGQKSVDLSVDPSVTNISWTPVKVFLSASDADKNSVTVYPTNTRELIRITGTDAQSCIESDSVTLVNEFTIADKNFSPNGDGIGDCWEVSNSQADDFSSCKVTIFDSKGRNVIQQTGPFPDDCIWNGKQDNGNDLPDGVYYFVLKCENSNLDRSGSILLAR
jgi:gliding motility-associated-like protein